MEESGSCSACFLRKRGAAGELDALSGANAPALPKGEPLAKPEALHLNREVYRHAKGSPFGRAGTVGD